MKRLFGIMNLILCLELIIGPHFPGTRIFSLNVARAETCPAGLVMDSTLNRCITSDQQAELINATASCNGDKECYKRIAEEKLKEAEAEGKIPEAVANKGGLVGTLGKIAAIAGPLTVVMAAFQTRACLNPSGIAMIAGGVAFTAGNFMADRKHKSCLKKIRSDWEKKKAETTEKTSSGLSKVSMSQDQSEAFEMLAKAEDCMASSAKMKAGFYAASTLAFAASAVMALMGVGTTENAPCTASTDSGPSKIDFKVYAQSIYNIEQATDIESVFLNAKTINDVESKSCASLDDYQILKETFGETLPKEKELLVGYLKEAYQGFKSEFRLFPEAHALNPILMPAGLVQAGAAAAPVVAAPAAATGLGPGILRTMNTPTGRAVIGGVLAGLSAMMWMHAKKQAKVAANRAEFLRKMKEDFNDSLGAISCSEEERSMSGNANCYCYTEGGQRNQARANSQVCQQLWTGQTLANAGEYNSLDFSNQRVCIAASGAPDENCACKASKNCLNAIPSMGNLGLGAISVASNGMKPLNDLANGQIGAGSINGAALLNGAARLLDQRNKLADKMKLDPNKRNKMARDFEKSIITAGAGAASPLASNSSPLPMNMSASDAASALEKELGGGSTFGQVSGSPAIAQPGNSTPGDVEGFSLGTPDAVAPTENQLAEAMAQDLNYNQNDITKSDSNIFQILTNRYQRSGMRRLFDEDAKATPEKANKNDISP